MRKTVWREWQLFMHGVLSIHLLSRTGLAVMIIGCLGFFSGCREQSTSPAAPLPTVTVATPVTRTVTDYLTFTGNTAAVDSVTLTARVEGYLEGIHFKDGTRVKKGDVLFTIEPDLYAAQVRQAQAQVLAQKAALEHAGRELDRYTHLVKADAATQTEVDHWRYEKAAAAAGLQSAQAQLAIANLNLSYTQVRAPFDGRAGRHLVDPGNVVGAMGKQTSLVDIQRIDPIYAYFTVNERELLRIMAHLRRTGGPPISQRHIPVDLGLLSETGYPHKGELDFASVSVTSTTGTLELRGIFSNPDFSLLPGLFVRVRVPTVRERDALLVPGEAVGFDQQGEYLLIVNEKNIVKRIGVKTGQQIGDMLVIEKGLAAGDRVIIEGLQQAIPGGKVVIRPAGGTPPSSGKTEAAGG
jgi:RND family efflux transporter MFP subunit